MIVAFRKYCFAMIVVIVCCPATSSFSTVQGDAAVSYAKCVATMQRLTEGRVSQTQPPRDMEKAIETLYRLSKESCSKEAAALDRSLSNLPDSQKERRLAAIEKDTRIWFCEVIKAGAQLLIAKATDMKHYDQREKVARQ